MSASSSDRVITEEELGQHKTAESLWLGINGGVYDVTKFLKMHPGGKWMLLTVGGTDCSEQFYALHHKSVLEKYKRFRIGSLKVSLDEAAASDSSKKGKGKGKNGKIPYIPTDAEEIISHVPYAEMPLFREGWVDSPYMNDSHKKFFKDLRNFLRTEIIPEAQEGEMSGEYPTSEIYQKMGKFGLLASRIGTACMPVVKKMNIRLPGGIHPDEFDPFHEMIAHDLMGRIREPGFNDGLGAGFCIGLPPVFYFAKKPLQMEVIPQVLLGQKRICLAISEPSVGSDVAGLITVAKKSECGKFYIVNGIKKWITGGMFADYFITAARTGGKGMKGISMMLIKAGPGVTVKQIKTSYATSAGTALVMFDDCKVPIENLFGKENQGFKCIMANFNHERWFIVSQMQGAMRQIVQECFMWGQQRMVFGHILNNQPVIRQKLAKMIAAIEGQQAFLESITYQMHKMDYMTQALKLAGPIALLKYQCTRHATMISDEACQIFGGRAISKTGLGDGIEKFQRTFKFAAILGGSEEIMADLGIRQAMREYPNNARL